MLKAYRYYLQIERAMSPNTVASYCSDVQAFIQWLKTDGGGIAPEDVGSADIIAYLGSLSFLLSKRSQARLLSSFKSFYNWMVLEGYIADNPCDAVDTPKLGIYFPEVLSIEEVEAIMDSVPLGTWDGLRDRAFLEILYGCGLRVSEAADLKISQIFFNDGFLRVVGKGDKERMVPVGDVALDAVKAYLAVRLEPKSGRDDDVLFISRVRKAISRVALFNIVKKYAMLAGITKEISPHTFRHSFATHLIENGADLRVVQEMLGHESILTTEIYTHIDKNTWQAAVIAHHPRR